MQRICFMVALMLLVMGILLFGFSGRNTWAADKLKFGIPAKIAPIYSLVMSAVEERDIWTRKGLEAEVFYVKGGVRLMQAIATRDIDMAGMTALGLLQPISKGIPVIILAEWLKKNEWGIYVSYESRIKKAEDLLGVKLGVTRVGSTGHFYAKTALDALGIKVKFISAGGIRSNLAALQTGAIDASIHAKSVMAHRLVTHKVRELIAIVDYLPKPWMEHTVFARKDFVNNQPDTAKRGVRVILDAIGFVKNNPSWTAEKMRSIYNYTINEANEVINSFQFTEDGRINEKALANVRSFAIKYGLVARGKTPPVKELYIEGFTD